MTFIMVLPMLLAFLCGAGLLMIPSQPVDSDRPARMAWLDDAYAYASEPLFEEEKTHERQT